MTPGFDEPATGEVEWASKCVGADHVAKQARYPDEVRALPSPKEVSAEEVARHCLTHLPYADWCPYCVAGKRPNSPHRRVRGTNWTIPMLCLDYGFFHDDGKPLITMLVVSIRPFNVYFAAVGSKK